MADAVVIPGIWYGPGIPLLMYAGDVAEQRGATVHRYSWSQEFPKPDQPEIESWVGGEIAPLIDTVGGRPLLIGKSLGTNAAAIAARKILARRVAHALAHPAVGG